MASSESPGQNVMVSGDAGEQRKGGHEDGFYREAGDVAVYSTGDAMRRGPA